MATGGPDFYTGNVLYGASGGAPNTVHVDSAGNLSTIIKGMSGSVVVPLNVDGGALTALLKAAYGSVLKTVACDSTGRITVDVSAATVAKISTDQIYIPKTMIYKSQNYTTPSPMIILTAPFDCIISTLKFSWIEGLLGGPPYLIHNHAGDEVFRYSYYDFVNYLCGNFSGSRWRILKLDESADILEVALTLPYKMLSGDTLVITYPTIASASVTAYAEYYEA